MLNPTGALQTLQWNVVLEQASKSNDLWGPGSWIGRESLAPSRELHGSSQPSVQGLLGDAATLPASGQAYCTEPAKHSPRNCQACLHMQGHRSLAALADVIN